MERGSVKVGSMRGGSVGRGAPGAERKKRAVILGGGAVLLLTWLFAMVVSVVTGGRGGMVDSDPARDAEVLESMTIPEFVGKDQNGRAVGRSIFTQPGRYVVLNFVFTHCVTVCPITTGQMIRVQEASKEIAASRLHLVSFSVDPGRDTPEAMLAHAQGFADFERWTFVSTDAEAVKNVVEKGLGFALEDDPKSTIDLPDGTRMNNIVHPSKMLLISPEGKVVGMFRGLDEEDVGRLIKQLGALR